MTQSAPSESLGIDPPRRCDLVMKGGITSGVVYPLAAVELSEHYQFRNVGGTSAGAIAAAAVAAAEHGKRTGQGTGYEGIKSLPDWLGRNMLSLFQPSLRMRPFFHTMLSASSGGQAAKWLAAPNSFPLAALLGLAPGAALIGLAASANSETLLRVMAVVAGAILIPVGMVTFILISAAWRLRGLPKHQFGICSGNDKGGPDEPKALTRWLADQLDELAGKSVPDQPLTFGDLYDLGEGDECLNLQMITTNLLGPACLPAG